MIEYEKEKNRDRIYSHFKGDWLCLLEYPCEFVTYLFMAMKRTNNNDNFLRIENKSVKKIFVFLLKILSSLDSNMSVEISVVE